MKRIRNRILHRATASLAAIGCLALFGPGTTFALDTETAAPTPVELVLPQETVHHALAREEALVLESTEGYNSGYIFGMTKGIANSTVHPAVKGPLFLLTVPLDLVFLPFAAIGGLF